MEDIILFYDCVFQEVYRIKAEHPDDNQAILNDRVKGQLKVTRAFGAGFLKRVSPFCNLLTYLICFLGYKTEELFTFYS